MLARYTIYRGPRPGSDPLPRGHRQDTRWRRNHLFSPQRAAVEAYLSNPTDSAWKQFERKYLALLQRRFRTDRQAFDELARLARQEDVFIGCSCPTKRHPTVERCHTTLALRFMKKRYPSLSVALPPVG
jgi:uncharacterized protein YeaO (DUF488 family)